MAIENGNEFVWESVEVITISEVLDQVFGKDRYQKLIPYREQNEAITKWIKENDSHYYAAVKENFSIWTGQKAAYEKGKSKVVVDNLS